jgi:hypothetical protein
VLFGSVTEMGAAHRGQHVLVGSHGGEATGWHALKCGVASLICHGAGVGKEEAGTRALSLLDRFHVPAAAVSHLTARIGDPSDMAERGILSRVNETALGLGLCAEMAASEALAGLSGARVASLAFAPDPDMVRDAFRRYPVARPGSLRSGEGRAVIALDSASSVCADDDDCILITGSHGGLPGNARSRAMKAHPFLAVFNDAGVGIDGAGIRRLEALDEDAIAAACVGAWSARIGDGRSTYETGVISHANEKAIGLGARTGMSVRDLVDRLVGGPARTVPA